MKFHFVRLVCPGWLLIPWLFLTACGLLERSAPLPPIVYLGWDENGRSQIFRATLDEEPEALTSDSTGVFDYAVAPDSAHIVYSVVTPNGDSAIWLIDKNGRNPQQIHQCKLAECARLVWAPDSRKIIFEHRPVLADGVAGSPILWWLDTRSGAVESVLEDENARGTAARFSPDGQWLSYVSPEEEGTFVYNLFDGRSAFYPNEVGMPAAWHPTEEQLVIPNLDVVVIHGDEGEEHETHTHDFETAVHLFLADPATGEREQISPSMPVDDGSPAWSPDGEWLVVGRKKPRTATGRQLWLMRADGSEQRALTDDLLVNYGPPAWSPDGRFLLFQRFDLEDPNAEPAIWLFDLETESMQPIVAEGMQPAWLNP